MKEKKDSVKRVFEFTRESNSRLERLVVIYGASSVTDFLLQCVRKMDFFLTECDLSAGVTVTKKTGETATLVFKDI